MDLLIALFSIGFLVWMIPLIRSSRLIVFALMVLGIGTVFGPNFFAIDSVIQFSVDRLLWFAMVGFFFIGWRIGRVQVPTLARADWLVLGIVVWFLISALSDQPLTRGTPPLARWFFCIAMPAGMYACARLIRVRAEDVRWILAGSVILSLYLSITAVFEISGLHYAVFPKFIVDPEAWEFYGRGRGPLLNPSGNGFIISLGLCAVVMTFLHARRHAKPLYAGIACILCVGIYATLTRSVWLGACAILGIVCLVYAPRWVRVLGLAAVVVVGSASVVGLKDQLVRLKRDKNLSAAEAEKSISLRPLLAVVAWEMFQDRPLVGHGYGHYIKHSDPYHNDRSYGLPLEQARDYLQHNVFLSILVDTGLVGFAMFVGWLGTITAIGWRLSRAVVIENETRLIGMLLLAAIASYLCNGMFHDVMIIPMVHMFLFFLAGISVTVFQRGIAAAQVHVWPKNEVRLVAAR